MTDDRHPPSEYRWARQVSAVLLIAVVVLVVVLDVIVEGYEVSPPVLVPRARTAVEIVVGLNSHRVDATVARRRLAKRTVEAHVAVHGWSCPGWHREPHPVRPGELAADRPVPLVLGGEPLPARPGVLCASCNARRVE
jgi:hypothetical protein